MTAIVCVSRNWGIGKDGALLFHISDDLKRFRALTTGKTVVLGRKTLETFPNGKPLKNRTNIILTNNPAYRAEGALIAHGTDELFSLLRAQEREQICVIGGASVYRLLLDYCDTARVTKTYVNQKADAFFPNLDALDNWSVSDTSEIYVENGIRFQYIDYVNPCPKSLPTE